MGGIGAHKLQGVSLATIYMCMYMTGDCAVTEQMTESHDICVDGYDKRIWSCVITDRQAVAQKQTLSHCKYCYMFHTTFEKQHIVCASSEKHAGALGDVTVFVIAASFVQYLRFICTHPLLHDRRSRSCGRC